MPDPDHRQKAQPRAATDSLMRFLRRVAPNSGRPGKRASEPGIVPGAPVQLNFFIELTERVIVRDVPFTDPDGTWGTLAAQPAGPGWRAADYCYQSSEVRFCEAIKCPLWPFRAGKHLWHASRERTPSDRHGFRRRESIQSEPIDRDAGTG